MDRNLPPEFKHDVFISYSRKDAPFARALEKALRVYTPPRSLKVPQRPLRVFRDESDFVGPDYQNAIQQHLKASDKLVVLCSPDARQSIYVSDEIDRFSKICLERQQGTSDTNGAIVPILLRGIPNNEAIGNQQAEAAYPDKLYECLHMPLGADFRGLDLARQKLTHVPYAGAWFKTLADIYGVSRAEVEQREEKRRARLHLAKVFAVTTLLLISFGLAGWVVWTRSDRYQVRESLAQGSQLAARGGEAAAPIWSMVLATTGDWPGSLAVIEPLTDRWAKRDAFEKCADVFFAIGDRASARIAAEQSLKLARSAPSPDAYDSVLECLLRIGAEAEARAAFPEMLKSLSGADTSDRTRLVDLTRSWAIKFGQAKEFAAAFGAPKDAEADLEARVRLTSDLLATGKTDEARNMAKNVLAAKANTEGKVPANRPLCELLADCVNLELPEEAVAVAAEIKGDLSDDEKTVLRRVITNALSSVSRKKELALRIVRALPEPEMRFFALVEAGGTLFTAGDGKEAVAVLAEAENTLRHFESPYAQPASAITLSEAFTDAGRLPDGRRIAKFAIEKIRALTNAENYAWNLMGAAVALAKAGDPTNAQKIVPPIFSSEDIKDALIGTRFRSEFAEKFAWIGLGDEALAAARGPLVSLDEQGYVNLVHAFVSVQDLPHARLAAVAALEREFGGLPPSSSKWKLEEMALKLSATMGLPETRLALQNTATQAGTNADELIQIAEAFMRIGDKENTASILQRTLPAAGQKETNITPNSLTSAAIIFLKLGRPGRSAALTQSAIRQAQRTEDPEPRTQALLSLTQQFLDANLPNAKQALETAMVAAQQIQNDNDQSTACLAATKLFVRMRDYRQARAATKACRVVSSQFQGCATVIVGFAAERAPKLDELFSKSIE